MTIPGVAPVNLKTWVVDLKAKIWKRSICYNRKPLLYCLSHLGLSVDPGKSIESPTLSQSCAQASAAPDRQPVLAFVKAFRLKGDNESLKSAIASRFDVGLVATAV